MRVLFLFMDGVGLGANDPAINPFARAPLPALKALLEGRRLTLENAPFDGERASLHPLDAALGVNGLPQSASGQAALLTGRNAPAELGMHYGPKPNPPLAAMVANGSLFSETLKAGRCAAFHNAYPPGYFAAVDSGKRLHAAIALSAVSAGLTLHDLDDLRRGQAVAADFTALGLRERLELEDVPVISAYDAGRRLAALSLDCDFSLFEYWLSDYAGHSQDMDAALATLETFDAALGGLADGWDDDAGLVLITSDHGNLEDLSTRRHTLNPVPALLIGSKAARREFAAGLNTITDVYPAVLRSLRLGGSLFSRISRYTSSPK